MLPDKIPEEFFSDGCTGFVDTWRGIDLLPCCHAHDLAWFQHPGDWGVWITSNIELGACFVSLGAWELAIPAVLAVCTVGAFLFASKRRKS